MTFASTNNHMWQRAYMNDLTLVDSKDAAHQPATVAGTVCAGWPMTDLAPPSASPPPIRDQGAALTRSRFGPVIVCFAFVAGAGEKLTLDWDPDVGLLGSPVHIPLR